MKKTHLIASCILIFVLAAGCSVLSGLNTQPDISGTWNGEVKSESGDVQRGVMKITRNSDGTFAGTLIAADNNRSDIPVDVVTRSEKNVHFEVRSMDGVFDGVIDGPGTTITGEWLISGRKFDVVMKKEQ